MFGFNKNENEQDQKLINFLDICSFIETYIIELRFGIIATIALFCFLFDLFDSFIITLAISLLLGNLIVNIICMFTIDRQYNVIYKQLKYPLIVKEVNINKEDELANINNEHPKIPGIDFVYEIKQKADDNFAVAFQVDNEHYKVLTSVSCSNISENRKKISSDVLSNSFSGLRKDTVYSNKCLIVNIIRLKREVEDLEIIGVNDIDDTLIITECVYYPYIK